MSTDSCFLICLFQAKPKNSEVVCIHILLSEDRPRSCLPVNNIVAPQVCKSIENDEVIQEIAALINFWDCVLEAQWSSRNPYEIIV